MLIEDMYTKVFKALAHPIRIKIVKELVNRELCVCELNENVEFTQSNLSQHLKILKDAGILKSEKDGLKIMYSIKDRRVVDIISIVDDMIKDDIKNMSNKLKSVE
ncbi:metalloregulator ArsR/SmtB family transcription factor [Clostridium sp. ZC22-4]|uniref:Metalloregulator ArsR/SmtB family transcription factor n=2 Tax=Clostridium brassicae TaxID=2999072 RepID=A0ABT4DD14_9CLOT|nr:metalloregulator ArsR/SmtB family transcription factor [Clostridium brassicae]MCY6960185.1 metalloregulator ArsR/SmtB family transcription factor [Clostridium brassicae]